MDRIRRTVLSTFVVQRLPQRISKHPEHHESRDMDSDDPMEPLMEDGKAGSQHDQSSQPQARKCSRPFLLTCPALVALILLSLVIGAAIVIGINSISHQSRVLVKPCGNSPEEARSRGCHFDVISFCWLAPECYDAELSTEFDNANALEWYLDPNQTIPLSHDQIMTGEWTDLYVNWEYHLRHCTAMWKKLHRAVMTGRGRQSIDGYIGTLIHTEHCEKMLLGDRQIAWDEFNTRIKVKYPACGV